MQASAKRSSLFGRSIYNDNVIFLKDCQQLQDRPKTIIFILHHHFLLLFRQSVNSSEILSILLRRQGLDSGKLPTAAMTLPGPEACTIKIFVIYSMLLTGKHFHPSLMFPRKDRGLNVTNFYGRNLGMFVMIWILECLSLRSF